MKVGIYTMLGMFPVFAYKIKDMHVMSGRATQHILIVFRCCSGKGTKALRNELRQ